MFEMIGTVNSYAQQQNLKKSAEYKKKTGVSFEQLKQQAEQIAKANTSVIDQMLQAQKSKSDEASKQRVSSIKNKLLAGKKLSQTEIEYLRDRDPKLYKKAKAAEEARNELKAALKHAKTKQEARMALTQAMVKASAETMAELSASKAGVNPSAVAGGNSEVANDVNAQNSNALVNSETSNNALINSETAAEDNSQLILAENVTETNAEIAEENQSEVQAEDESVETENVDEKTAEVEDKSAESTDKTSDEDKDTPQDIMEKFIMVIRALEDEFVAFTNSKRYRYLPEGIDSKKKIQVPNKNVHDMILQYRMQSNKSFT